MCAKHTANNNHMIFGSLTGLARTTSKEDLLEMTFTERMYHTSGFNLEKWYINFVLALLSWQVVFWWNLTCKLLSFPDLEKWNETSLLWQWDLNTRRAGSVRCPASCITCSGNGNYTSCFGMLSLSMVDSTLNFNLAVVFIQLMSLAKKFSILPVYKQEVQRIIIYTFFQPCSCWKSAWEAMWSRVSPNPIEENLQKCPKHAKGCNNVAKWSSRDLC
jgi:hypothetical protein